ncbi:mCG128061 [Mus musculus]|nr:mCG128061 [Mus musculus]
MPEQFFPALEKDNISKVCNSFLTCLGESMVYYLKEEKRSGPALKKACQPLDYEDTDYQDGSSCPGCPPEVRSSCPGDPVQGASLRCSQKTPSCTEPRDCRQISNILPLWQIMDRLAS